MNNRARRILLLARVCAFLGMRVDSESIYHKMAQSIVIWPPLFTWHKKIIRLEITAEELL